MSDIAVIRAVLLELHPAEVVPVGPNSYAWQCRCGAHRCLDDLTDSKTADKERAAHIAEQVLDGLSHRLLPADAEYEKVHWHGPAICPHAGCIVRPTSEQETWTGRRRQLAVEVAS